MEGEGCFFISHRQGRGRKYDRVGIQLTMTDEDPVARAASIMGISYSKRSFVTKGGKPIFVSGVSGPRAVAWMMTLWALMGIRRRAKIQECLDCWHKSPTKTDLSKYMTRYQPRRMS